MNKSYIFIDPFILGEYTCVMNEREIQVDVTKKYNMPSNIVSVK